MGNKVKNKSDDCKFIRTSDLESIAILKGLGFTVVSEDNGTCTFLNEHKAVFSGGLKGLVYTNMLYV